LAICTVLKENCAKCVASMPSSEPRWVKSVSRLNADWSPTADVVPVG
jgi:hypothetical protein